jgi:chemotaxis protein methyltransferase CheR
MSGGGQTTRPRSRASQSPSVAPRKSRRPSSLVPASRKRPVFSDGDFSRFCRLITAGLGTRTPAAKRALIEARILGRLRDLGLSSFAAYGDLLETSGASGGEMAKFIDLATTNETSFFRERPQLDALVSEVVPVLSDDAAHTGRHLRVWSAACSNGAEVWTLAMLLEDFRMRSGSHWEFEVLGTDVSTAMLAAAVQASYASQLLDNIPPVLRKRYVVESKNKPDGHIAPALRSRASFRRLNLIAPVYEVAREFDLIFLRNVLIYFDSHTKDAVLQKVCAHLRPGAVLCVGLAESVRQHAELGLERLGASRYRMKAAR